MGGILTISENPVKLDENVVLEIKNRKNIKREVFVIDLYGDIWKSIVNGRKGKITKKTSENYEEIEVNPCMDNLLLSATDGDRIAQIRKKEEFLLNFIETITNSPCTPYERNVVYRICDNMYTEFFEGNDRKSITLNDFYESFINDGTPEGCKIAAYIEPYCVGINAINKVISVKTIGKVTVFDLSAYSYRHLNVAFMCCVEHICNLVMDSHINRKINFDVYIPCYSEMMCNHGVSNEILNFFKEIGDYSIFPICIRLASDNECSFYEGTGRVVLSKMNSIYNIDLKDDEKEDIENNENDNSTC